MKLAVLPTGVHTRGQLGEELVIERSPDERRVKLRRVDTHEDGAKTGVDELAGERGRVATPERKHGALADGGKTSLAIRADVGEEQVAKGDRLQLFQGRFCECALHPLLVYVVRAQRRDLHLDQRNAGCPRLPLEQLAPHAVHRYASVVNRHGCDQRTGSRTTRPQAPERER